MPNPLTTLKRAKNLDFSIPKHKPLHIREETILVPTGTRVIQVDGSWDCQKNAGIGMVIYDAHGQLQRAKGNYLKAPDPLQVEAMAMNQALEQIEVMISSNRLDQYQVLTDSSILVKAITQANLDVVPTWEAAQVIAYSIRLARQLEGRVKIRYTCRNYVTQAHNMANWARQTKAAFNGYPSEGFRESIRLAVQIDPTKFSYDSS